MPKYIYQCGVCPGDFEIYHGMMDDEAHCLQCGSEDFYRVPQMPFLKSSDPIKGSKVGDEVKAAIEANKVVLKEAKQEAKRSFYDDS